jgi:hypothetical protein
VCFEALWRSGHAGHHFEQFATPALDKEPLKIYKFLTIYISFHAFNILNDFIIP